MFDNFNLILDEYDLLQGGIDDDVLLGDLDRYELVGSLDNDYLIGHFDNDWILGGQGEDYLDGGPGDDLIEGGQGSDLIKLGDGLDVVVLEPGDGFDILLDYRDGQDKILINELKFNELTISHLNSVDTVISINKPGSDNDGENLVLLKNINQNLLDENDFIFHQTSVISTLGASKVPEIIEIAGIDDFNNEQSVTIPEITTEPIVLGQKTLQWLREGGNDTISPRPFDYPDLTGQANVLDDWHMQTSPDDWDLLVSTAGNFHRFLNVFHRKEYLPNNPVVSSGQWGYSTSPPVSIEQLDNGGRLTFGNMEIRGIPMVVMGPNSIMNAVVDGGYNDGEPAKILSNFGNVLLVPAGNPKNLEDIWDLGRKGVRVVTSNPETEPGSFANYSSSVFNIAFREVEAATGDIDIADRRASKLFNRVFNPEDNETREKWVVGDRIHHRDVPQALANGEADVGLMFYHLAQTALEANPDLFEIVPLGGTVDNPEPLLGNRVATMQAIRIDGDWTPQQIINRDNFFFGITDSVANSDLLEQFWLREPVTTGNNQPPLP